MIGTATANREQLRARASVVADFDVSRFVADEDDADEVLDFLEEDCQQVETPAGSLRWTIKDALRREMFVSVPLSELRWLRGQVVVDEQSGLQAALDQSLLSGWTDATLTRLSLADARAVAVVAGWWDGTRDGVPSGSWMHSHVDRLALFADVRAMADNHFIGRATELAMLRTHFERSDGPLLIHGLGGMGKSALVARHIVWALDHAGARVALLDFDDPTLDPHNPAKLAERVIDLISRQVDQNNLKTAAFINFGTLRETRARARDVAEHGSYAAESNARRNLNARFSAWDYLIGDLLSALGNDDPILVVFDTFEQVQRRGPTAVDAVAQLVDVLRQWSRIRIVVSGRVDPLGELPGTSWQLGGLDDGEAVTLLTELAAAPVTEDTARAVVNRVGTSPLTIRLAARLLADAHETDDLLVLGIDIEQVDAELYRRVLAHIPDQEVRMLAHPGLVLRRITADIIRNVLAEPCGVDVQDARDAEELLERLAREVMLVDRDGGALVHRSDVRRTMLRQLLLSRPSEARRIQESAVAYYVDRDGLSDRVEELYHRLMLGQSEETLNERWDVRAAGQLIAVKDELPEASRLYLRLRSNDEYISNEDLQAVTDREWRVQAEPQVLRWLDAGHPAEALEALWERGASHQSLLPALEIEALESASLFGKAIAIARRERRSAAERHDIADVVTYSLHLARLLDRVHRVGETRVVLDDALAVVKNPTIDRLRLLVAWLGTFRRAREVDSATRYEYYHECLDLYVSIGPLEIQQVRGLLRDLAAEAGAAAPGMVTTTLRNVGISPQSTDLIPNALREMAEDLVVRKGVRPENLAEVARVTHADDGVHWSEILKKNRGDAGRALADVLDTFAGLGDGYRGVGLIHAVVLEYQTESDAAYFGADFPGPSSDYVKQEVVNHHASHENAALRTHIADAIVEEGVLLSRSGEYGTALSVFQQVKDMFERDPDAGVQAVVKRSARHIEDIRQRLGPSGVATVTDGSVKGIWDKSWNDARSRLVVGLLAESIHGTEEIRHLIDICGIQYEWNFAMTPLQRWLGIIQTAHYTGKLATLLDEIVKAMPALGAQIAELFEAE